MVRRRAGCCTTAPWVAEELQLPYEELVADIRLLLANGERYQGADVYRYVMRRIWWAWPLYVLTTLPLLRTLFDAAYRRFADNRYWISRTCHMPAKTPLEADFGEGRPRTPSP
jgi:predicted DCC family thiol-disulfide oxidoreductase YuxK